MATEFVFIPEVWDPNSNDPPRALGVYLSDESALGVLQKFADDCYEDGYGDESDDEEERFSLKLFNEFEHDKPHESGATKVKLFEINGGEYEASLIKYEIKP